MRVDKPIWRPTFEEPTLHVLIVGDAKDRIPVVSGRKRADDIWSPRRSFLWR